MTFDAMTTEASQPVLYRAPAAVDVYAAKSTENILQKQASFEKVLSSSTTHSPPLSQLSLCLSKVDEGSKSTLPVQGDLPPPERSPQPGLTFDATDLTLCSGVSPPPLLPVKPEHVEHVLTSGIRMIKYPSKASSRPAERHIRVDLQSLQIFWESKKKKSHQSSVDLHAVREIRLGQNTKGFELHGKRPEYEDRAFTVIYVASGEYKMLNLVAPSKEDAALWISGLHMLIAQSDLTDGDPARVSQNMSTWLRKRWHEADTSGDGKLDLDEVTALMKKLNIRLSKSEVKSTFKSANVGKEGCLNFPAFERLYRMLRFRPEVSELFSSLSRTKTSVITYEEFQDFVKNIQKNEWTEERCLDIYQKYAAPDGGQMSVDHFSAFLLSANNAIFRKSHTVVFQDMTQPLTDYYINTSHNTYLLKDQLTGESSVEGYIRALQRGCRCVELDCYDGPNGSPVIYHGRTLVSKLLFKDVIDAIAKYAFVASPYPLTLSLESHCGLEQQAVMAKILKDALGDALLQRPLAENETALPSPEALKNKIIIKGKLFPSNASEDDTDYETEDEDGEQQEGPIQQMANITDLPLSTAPMISRQVNRKIVIATSPVDDVEIGVRRRTSDEDVGLTRKKSSPRMARKYVAAKTLSDLLIYCKGVHFASFATALEKFDFDHMCSLSEKKSLALLQRQKKEYIDHTKRYLTRIYPAGIRVNSSNYDPLPHWQVGAQMVAMNYQTFDKGMQLNHAMFNLNGRCGYVLKPSFLRRGQPAVSPVPVMLNVKIISGQQLPKPKDSTGSTVIDPYVEVEIVGSEVDTARFRTRAINNNGFNPMWKEEFRFIITDRELAFLRFSIFDMDVKLTNDFIGSYTIPVQSLKQGYRHVPLYNWKGDLVRFSSLFVCLSIQPIATQTASPPASPSLGRSYPKSNGEGGANANGHVETKRTSGSDAKSPSRTASGSDASAPRQRNLSLGSLASGALGLR
ncbi:phosphatidylinositol phospholipase C [Spizellomyces punctatus DAOM BR117]|uniref:Phosphoinositide phospholipase C n=1 Tax=Spizellomyces punctatus (strain DAOM BR117) TaxID=645134 RepID=A0A0L0HJ25_SPIPD|nr:phosphatidylinositol phospholipase C [Spizellomyces punctatus DAOM BR117]KND00834.1 hypothetical protein SPPG_03939 [Spizellomyces punctatus DAOM BR117]|eukprot:XP_016608873.1 hypothetical protein SPPG_03939 [Spizellomyces punctatus DAOM BR117]